MIRRLGTLPSDQMRQVEDAVKLWLGRDTSSEAKRTNHGCTRRTRKRAFVVGPFPLVPGRSGLRWIGARKGSPRRRRRTTKVCDTPLPVLRPASCSSWSKAVTGRWTLQSPSSRCAVRCWQGRWSDEGGSLGLCHLLHRQNAHHTIGSCPKSAQHWTESAQHRMALAEVG